MDARTTKQLSKFLSLVLRHRPKLAGLTLDSAGWTDVATLLEGAAHAGTPMTREQLDVVVAENDKKRFEFDASGQRIRASQGHTVSVDLGYAQATPPDVLSHGTPERFVDSIRRQGLNKQKRHHVHLHQDRDLATTVGERRGKPVVLTVDAKAMHEAGHVFFVTPNQVWLTEHVPVEFIAF